MTDAMVLDLGREALKISVMLAGPLLIGALVAGVTVSVIQAITQVNEATMTFIPKILVITLILVLAGPWMLEQVTDYTRNLIVSVPIMLR